MKKILSLTVLFIFLTIPLQTYAASTFEGGVSAQGRGNSSRIVDKKTGAGVDGAKITLPKERYSTTTDAEGYFELDTQINGTSIMSVEKKNYKPFSVTVTDRTVAAPIVIGIAFVAAGNYFPKSRRNYTVGIKIPWTLNSDENWKKTHHLAAYMWMISGVLIILMAILPGGFLYVGLPAAILLMAFVPIVYSYLLYRKGI